MKVLLTGATGFIGRHVLHSLREQSIPLVAIGRTMPPGCAVKKGKGADVRYAARV